MRHPIEALVLIGCEESGIVSGAFREKWGGQGLQAYSCDIQPTRGEEKFHLQCDIMEAIHEKPWDIIILHPDCTAMAISGNAHYGKQKPLHHKRLDAEAWTKTLWENTKKIAKIGCALENPKSTIWKVIGSPQFIHPWQFGHGEVKPTGILTHNLPPLTPTNIVDGREERIHNIPPSKNRKRIRSETYKGIAEAMAMQWGKFLIEKY